MNIGEALTLNEFGNIVNQIGNMIYYVFNQIIKLFFNDIRVFNVPIGAILILLIILSSITNSLLQVDNNG